MLTENVDIERASHKPKCKENQEDMPDFPTGSVRASQGGAGLGSWPLTPRFLPPSPPQPSGPRLPSCLGFCGAVRDVEGQVRASGAHRHRPLFAPLAPSDSIAAGLSEPNALMGRQERVGPVGEALHGVK